jgi:hypothetical protein
VKYTLATLLVIVLLLAGYALFGRALAMAPTQFGEFSEGYLKRKAERAEKRKQRRCIVDFRFDRALERGGEPTYIYGPCPKRRSSVMCFDFNRDDTPRGFARALERPVPCRDIVN